MRMWMSVYGVSTLFLNSWGLAQYLLLYRVIINPCSKTKQIYESGTIYKAWYGR